jgi:hypothetical protein
MSALTLTCWFLQACFILIEKPGLYSGGIILDYQIVAYAYPTSYDRISLCGTRYSLPTAIALSERPTIQNN